MGLSVSHGCFNGPYSSFNQWRVYLASLVGIKLHLMEGFYMPPESWTDWYPKYTEKQIKEIGEHQGELPVKWSSLPYDPIFKLLHHSDCEGYIALRDCKPLADRLEELLPLMDPPKKLTDKDVRLTSQMVARGYREDRLLAAMQGIIDDVSHINTTKKFIAGLRLADKQRRRVRFS